MPESPEVHALVSDLEQRIVGRVVSGIDIVIGKALKTQSPGPEVLIGCRVVGVRRFGKLIGIALEGPDGAALQFVVHWGHDGWLVPHPAVPEGVRRTGNAALIARVRFDDGSGFDLTDSGQWIALSMFIVTDAVEVPAIAKLGPDPTDPTFTEASLAAILAGRRKQLKALLQDQTALAGIGNAYSDEILHAAKLSPVMHASTLTAEEVAALHDAMRRILVDAMEARRGLAPDALKDDKRSNMRVHRRPGEACPVCGGVIAGFTFSGAAAQYCPTCQTGGQLLA